MCASHGVVRRESRRDGEAKEGAPLRRESRRGKTTEGSLSLAARIKAWGGALTLAARIEAWGGDRRLTEPLGALARAGRKLVLCRYRTRRLRKCLYGACCRAPGNDVDADGIHLQGTGQVRGARHAPKLSDHPNAQSNTFAAHAALAVAPVQSTPWMDLNRRLPYA